MHHMLSVSVRLDLTDHSETGSLLLLLDAFDRADSRTHLLLLFRYIREGVLILVGTDLKAAGIQLIEWRERELFLVVLVESSQLVIVLRIQTGFHSHIVPIVIYHSTTDNTESAPGISVPVC